ncbi:MAG: serine/threonine protein kinase, partial [Planctomycetes bacterium]|nr:serine/threonine protein kinase [Planctomycetota bacterium]
MSTTIFHESSATRTWNGHPVSRCSDKLVGRYRTIIEEQRLNWTEHHRLIRPVGAGGQGIVYLSERRGTDDFTLPVALKIFSPERYEDERSYDEAMGRIAQVAAHVAQIQQDNLLDVHNWLDRRRIRLMVMEWMDGYDLGRLLTRDMLERVRERVSNRRWKYINSVVATAGPMQPRLKPGIAIAIIRDCLAALAALHR